MPKTRLSSKPIINTTSLCSIKKSTKDKDISKISSDIIINDFIDKEKSKKHKILEYEDTTTNNNTHLKSLLCENWEEMYNLIKEQRSTIKAAVDEIGCSLLANPEENNAIFRYQVLIGHMLSSQTKDEMTFKAMQRLKEFGLTPDNIIKTSDDKISELINCVRFYKRKTTYIKDCTKRVIEMYDNDIPKTVKELTKFKGIGPKMAVNTINHAWNKTVGIGVDIHLHRICNRLGWVKTDSPENTRRDLEDWLPKDKWLEINGMLSGFGQSICKSTPKCNECSVKYLCPSSNIKDNKE